MDGLLSILPFALIVIAVAASGAVFKPGAWYESLNKPAWTPPKWAFPVVWTSLYIMIAAAGWLAWKAGGISLALIIWAINLAFNAAWSWIMFGRHDIRLALYDAFAMLATIIAFIALAWPLSQSAALLFVPYLVWVCLAIALNWRVLRDNPNASEPATA